MKVDLLQHIISYVSDDVVFSSVRFLGTLFLSCFFQMSGLLSIFEYHPPPPFFSGTPQTMTSLTNYGGDVVGDVCDKLEGCTRAAEKAGIPR